MLKAPDFQFDFKSGLTLGKIQKRVPEYSRNESEIQPEAGKKQQQQKTVM